MPFLPVIGLRQRRRPGRRVWAGWGGALALGVMFQANGFAAPLSGSALIWRAWSNNTWDTSTTNWLEAAPGTNRCAFTSGAEVIFDDTAANPTVNLPATVTPGSMTVSNGSASYTLAGAGGLAGTGSLTKAGAGVLTLSLSNRFTGGTLVNAGKLRVDHDAALGGGALTLSGGTLTAVGATARTLTNAVSLTTATTLGDATDKGRIILGNPVDFKGAARTLTVNSAVVFAGGATNGVIGAKQGAGALTIQGAVNWTGAADVRNGTLIFDGATVDSSDRIVTDVTGSGAARLVITNGASIVIGIATANLRAGRAASAGSNFVDLAGCYRLPNADGSSGKLMLQGNAAYSEITFWPGGDFAARSVTNNGGVGQTVFKFNGGILRACNDSWNFFEGLSNAVVQAGGALIDDGGYLIAINQDLRAGGGNGGLTKLGAGTLLLNGTNTYPGTTRVSEGALGGGGIISGPVSVAVGARLTVGPPTALGTLTISNDLTLDREAAVFMKINADYSTMDLVAGLQNVTYAGTLIVTNIGADTWADGETFKLFDAAESKSGNFNAINILPATGATGDFNPATGELTIHSGAPIPTALTNLALSVADQKVNLRWPSNYLGWSLQVQTNRLGVGLSTNWVTVPGGASVTAVNLPVSPTNGAVFYRLYYPVPTGAPTYTLANSLGPGADPTVMYRNGFYYGSKTGNANAGVAGATNAAIYLYRSPTLDGLFTSEPILLPVDAAAVAPDDAIWAPDMRYFDGHAYIYYHDHTVGQMRVLVSATADPFGAYTDRALSFPLSWTGVYGYDWTVFRRQDGTFWGFLARGLGCCVAAMSDPTTVSRNAVQISKVATNGWEALDNISGGCNEAPQVIAFPDPNDPGKEKIFVTYSANTYQRDDYAMGLLTFTGADTLPLDDANVAQNWIKQMDAAGNPVPAFSKANNIVSVGSNAMLEGPDGTW